MNKNIVWIIAIIIIAAGAFWGGMQYAQGQTPSRAGEGQSGQFGSRGLRTSGGVTAGQIISSDPTSLTLQTASSSMIIYFASSTQIFKTSTASESDLTPGAQVIITGSSNSDGSLTAQSIQIRPPGMLFIGGGRGGNSTQPSQG